MLSKLILFLTPLMFIPHGFCEDPQWNYRFSEGKLYDVTKSTNWVRLSIFKTSGHKMKDFKIIQMVDETSALTRGFTGSSDYIIIKNLPVGLSDGHPVPHHHKVRNAGSGEWVQLYLRKLGTTNYTTVTGARSTVDVFDFGTRPKADDAEPQK